MDDVIWRKDALASVCWDCPVKSDCRRGEECADYMRIKELPAADVRPVARGKWETPNAETTLCTCSVCGKVAPYDVEADTIMYWPALNFCPNCGAWMEEES